MNWLYFSKTHPCSFRYSVLTVVGSITQQQVCDLAELQSRALLWYELFCLPCIHQQERDHKFHPLSAQKNKTERWHVDAEHIQDPTKAHFQGPKCVLPLAKPGVKPVNGQGRFWLLGEFLTTCQTFQQRVLMHSRVTKEMSNFKVFLYANWENYTLQELNTKAEHCAFYFVHSKAWQGCSVFHQHCSRILRICPIYLTKVTPP